MRTQWRGDWPVIGADPDGDGVGEPATKTAIGGAGVFARAAPVRRRKGESAEVAPAGHGGLAISICIDGIRCCQMYNIATTQKLIQIRCTNHGIRDVV